MRYVIIRDDDTNALTPIDCLEWLYRPFLERGLPVNLATIPEVSTRVTLPDGRPEGFLAAGMPATTETVAIGSNKRLTSYLLDNPGFKILQHGLHHEYFEFERHDRFDIRRRLAEGTRLLREAGFPQPLTFVAPYDKFSRASLDEVARNFRVVSAGWFEHRRLPFSWWARFLLKKFSGAAHWQIRNTALLTHPGCLLSFQRPRETMLDEVRKAVESRPLTVLVTHWWEYFRNHQPDAAFISKLHETADYLAADSEIRVISFEDVAQGTVLPGN